MCVVHCDMCVNHLSRDAFGWFRIWLAGLQHLMSFVVFSGAARRLGTREEDEQLHQPAADQEHPRVEAEGEQEVEMVLSEVAASE